MIIYELEADYSNYLGALGAPTKLVRKYAYRNALLPQITGLALALGAVVAGAIVVEIVFSYPGLGTLTLERDPEPRLLPDPGDLPLPDHRSADRQLRHRHRLRLHRPAHAGRDAGRAVMPVSDRGTSESSPRARRPRRSTRRRPSPPRVCPSPHSASHVAPSSSTSHSGTGSSCWGRGSSSPSSRWPYSDRCSRTTRLSSSPARPISHLRRTTGSGRRRSARTCTPSSSTACGRPSSSEPSAAGSHG